MMHGFGFGFGAWGFLMMVVFWVVLIALSVWIVKAIFVGAAGSKGNARQILDERYARGEISKKEYSSMKKELAN
jgi:putative membrane protein